MMWLKLFGLPLTLLDSTATLGQSFVAQPIVGI
jgi:hypothetical protein